VKVIEKKRKTRSDKKKEVKPTLPLKLRECIYRISYITNTPVKDVAEYLCESGITSRKVMDHLSQHFRRDIRLLNTLYLGDLERPSLQKKTKEKKERVTIKFSQGTYENISILSYALDVTPTKATMLLLEASVKNADFINQYVEDHLGSYITEGKIKELKKVLKFINDNNPYEEEFSWTHLISYFFDELKHGSSSVKNAINEWVDKNKLD
jgi:hypothetical protein